MQFWRLVPLMILLPLEACTKPITAPTSAVKWGHNEDNISSSLFNTKPGDTIKICSDDPGNDGLIVEASLRDWFRAANRVNDINFVIEGINCNKDVEAMIFVYKNPVGEDLKYCQEKKPVGFAQGSRNGFGGKIVRCKSNVPTNDMLFHTLHETGHIIGLCDQYSVDANEKLTNPIGMHNKCSAKFRSKNNQASKSVMNAAGNGDIPQITLDDAQGAVEVANRSDLKSAGSWPTAVVPKNFLPNSER